jgi:hypothetical protein
MVLAMELINNSRAVVDSICDSINSSSDLSKLRALLFLINDILFNSVKVTNAWTYKKDFETRLPELMEGLNFKHDSDLRKSTKKLIRLWQDKNVFEHRFITGLEAVLTLKASAYALNLQTTPTARLSEPLHTILLSGLFTKQSQLASLDPSKIERQCRVNGLPTSGSKDDMVRKLLVLEEFKVRQCIKAHKHSIVKDEQQEIEA